MECFFSLPPKPDARSKRRPSWDPWESGPSCLALSSADFPCAHAPCSCLSGLLTTAWEEGSNLSRRLSKPPAFYCGIGPEVPLCAAPVSATWYPARCAPVSRLSGAAVPFPLRGLRSPHGRLALPPRWELLRLWPVSGKVRSLSTRRKARRARRCARRGGWTSRQGFGRGRTGV